MPPPVPKDGNVHLRYWTITGMKDVVSKVIGNWELIVGFTLVFIMLAGEKGIWGSLEPRLNRLMDRVTGKRSDEVGQ
jgi:hypothetical protein